MEIQLAASGDEDAMVAIYSRYIDASYNLAYRITMDKLLAEDACQEAFLKVMTKITKYKFEGSFAGWIRKIVVNETLGKLNHEKRTESLEDNMIDIADESNLFRSEWVIDSMELELLLQQLPSTYRTVLVLHEIEGYKHKEIAGLLKKSESFSKMTLLRTYQLLQKIIRQQERDYAPQ